MLQTGKQVSRRDIYLFIEIQHNGAKVNLKSTLTCEEKIHTKGRKLDMYSIYYAKQQ